MATGFHPDWVVPDWPAPAHVNAVCTTRAGGRSAAPYDTFNLGTHVGDDPAAVAANRALLGDATGARQAFLAQVHGTEVALWSGAEPSQAAAVQADAACTAVRGQACTVMVADCLPVLLTDRDGRAVAAAHAGWRGLAGQGGRGILEATLEQFRALAPTSKSFDATEIIAWLGPCIGPDAFEVGDEVKSAFASSGRFRAGRAGHWHADLAGLARDRLAAAGVGAVYGNDSGSTWCTVTQTLRFFSHRRASRLGGLHAATGRFAASIWIDDRRGGF